MLGFKLNFFSPERAQGSELDRDCFSIIFEGHEHLIFGHLVVLVLRLRVLVVNMLIESFRLFLEALEATK